ncbi:MAG: hypothetical protein ACRDF5_04520 [bacterium]
MAQYSPALEQRPVNTGGLWFLPFYVATIVALALLLAAGDAEEIRAAVILLLLTPLTLMIFGRAARADPDGAFLYRVLLLAWPAKLAAMAFKLYLLATVFGGADAAAYHNAGAAIAATLSSGELPEFTQYTSTKFVELVTGLFYFVTGPTSEGAWIFWSWLGTLGMLAHYKAFVTALPLGSRRWFAVLVFFSPTILMWTNALGKDALIAFTLGLAAYSVAIVSRRGISLRAIFFGVIGVGGSALVRPHIAAILSVGLTAAVLLRPIRAGVFTPIVRLATFLVMITLAVLVVRFAAAYLAVDLSVEGVEGFFEQQSEASEQGGSAFEGVGSFPTTPQALGLAIVTVLFRPFPWEGGSLLGVAVAMEGIALIALLLYRWRSILGAIWEARRHSYLAFVVIYAAIFTVAFSAVSNFGILSRQRAQLLPFIFVLLAYKGWRERVPPEPVDA